MRLCAAMARAAEAQRAGRVPAGKETGDSVPRLHSRLTRLLESVEEADALPTPAVGAAVDETIAALDAALAPGKERKR